MSGSPHPLTPSGEHDAVGRQRHSSANAAKSRAAAAIRKIDEVLAGTRNASRSVDDLAAAAGMPRRSLERAFRNVVGMAPAEYVRHRSLQDARRMLLEGAGGDRAVTHVAAACGFWHLGRFAAYYRRAFGETPSQTLRRQQQPAAAPAAADGT